ncbi:hypothetical protein [Saccharothrix yanglingensis]|uniref:Hemerythrin HHE cation binding domain-containing protein n=1 Tax=Saccharothrix yanglingensis TaxID=659496 RepID=A0ABU0X7S2_9PSEU|nr:hypothetical protein [Saccharothrix yanglingensis]MDQ2588178.1 hypothetical protein [Saccharothrix yanglingensis]
MSVTVFSQLDKSLHEHLDALVRLAATGDDETAVDLARGELPRVVTALRSLLTEHTPDEHGRCPTCRTRRWSRRLPSPCRAYLGAQLCLTVSGDEPSGRRRHLRSVG